MMHDVALGVEQLTHAGVIWIDGKPENVLVDRKPAGGFAVKVSGEGGQQGGGMKLQRGGQGRLMMARRGQRAGLGYAAMNSSP